MANRWSCPASRHGPRHPTEPRISESAPARARCDPLVEPHRLLLVADAGVPLIGLQSAQTAPPWQFAPPSYRRVPCPALQRLVRSRRSHLPRCRPTGRSRSDIERMGDWSSGHPLLRVSGAERVDGGRPVRIPDCSYRAAQPWLPVLRCFGASVRRADVHDGSFALTFSPKMAGYGRSLGAFGRCRHMVDPIKVFWQPH